MLFYLLLVGCASAQMMIPYQLSEETIQMVAQASKPQEDALTPCVDLTWNYCQDSFNSALGIDHTLRWRNGTVLFNKINALLATSTQEIIKVCNLRTQFYQCLGSSYYPCMNLFSILQKPNPDYYNAFDYTRTYLGLEFMCNAGFEEVVTQWGCLHGIQSTFAYTTCMSNFNETVNPNNLCGNVDSTGQCLMSAYKAACSSKGAGFFGCENFRFTFDQSCYGLRCNVV